jgi:hypothetical protein
MSADTKKKSPFKNLKRGAFTKQAKARGKSVAEFAREVLANARAAKEGRAKKRFDATTVRRARLALLFRKWARARKK